MTRDEISFGELKVSLKRARPLERSACHGGKAKRHGSNRAFGAKPSPSGAILALVRTGGLALGRAREGDRLGGLVLDVLDYVCDGLKLFSVFVGYFHPELVLKSHD